MTFYASSEEQAMTDQVDRLVGQFDWHDPTYTPERAEIVNRTIRERSAVTFSPAHGGFWVLSRYEDVKAALRDHETFISGAGVHFPRATGMPKFSPIDYDPPEQEVIRDLMAPPMEREALSKIKGSIEALAADLIAAPVAKGEGELASEVAQPFALGALGLSIGLSAEAQREVRSLTRTLWKHLSVDSDASQFWPAYHALLSEEIARARSDGGDHYLARLAVAEVDGEPISEDMLYSIIVSFCIAGHDNTMNTLNRIFWYLSQNRAEQIRLREDPDRIVPFIEEVLRRWCPTDRFTRVTTRDVEIDNTVIPKGARVVLLFDAANRDPDKFADPDEFRPERGNAQQHLSLGYGIHHCMGSHLARMEISAVLREMARQPPYLLTAPANLGFENGRHVTVDAIHVRFEDEAALNDE